MSSNLDEIDDMSEFCDIMKSFSLPTKGISTLNEIKIMLSKHLKDLEGASHERLER